MSLGTIRVVFDESVAATLTVTLSGAHIVDESGNSQTSVTETVASQHRLLVLDRAPTIGQPVLLTVVDPATGTKLLERGISVSRSVVHVPSGAVTIDAAAFG